MTLHIGIDVGPTHTDAVVMRAGRVHAWAKAPTTADVTSGIAAALQEVLGAVDERVAAVRVGTPQFTNAVVERRHLEPVAVLRLGAPATESLPPLVDWPPEVARLVLGHRQILAGGHELDGRELTPLDAGAVRRAARSLTAADLRLIAITAVFSPLDPSSELRAAAVVREAMPDAEITLSHALSGRLGLLERENAAVLNAALVPLARSTVAALRRVIEEAGVGAPLYLTQNDGTLMDADYASRYPVLTFASGTANAMRGASYLSGVVDGFAIDVGGTTTNVGALVHGRPRPAVAGTTIGGVSIGSRMPELHCIGLGGGSVVGFHPPRVGPRSVGPRIAREAWVFGGKTPTATDVAVGFGRGDLGNVSLLGRFDPMEYEEILELIDALLDDAIDRLRTHEEPAPVVAAGGASFLVPDDLGGASKVIHPEHAAVANAVGAAIARVGGVVERVVRREAATLPATLDECRREALERAELAGAVPGSVTIEGEDEVALFQLPSKLARVRINATGEARL